ncbi:MAG: O-antigen ligase family protein [Candidatus Dormibacteria bacterium]
MQLPSQGLSAFDWRWALLATLVLVPILIGLLAAGLRHPIVVVYGAAAFIPFSLIGSLPTSGALIGLAKAAENGLILGAALLAIVGSGADHSWLKSTALGRCLLAFFVWTGFASLVGIVGAFPGHGMFSDWLKESDWLSLYLFAIPVGSLVNTRRRLAGLLGILAASACISQVLALLYLRSAARYARPDWAGGETFQRAPYSEAHVLLLLLAVAFLVVGGRLRYSRTANAVAISGGLLMAIGLVATLGRSLWLSVVVGVGVVVLAPGLRKRVVAVVLSLVLFLIATPVLVGNLTGASATSGQSGTAILTSFLLAGATEGNVSSLARVAEDSHAVSVWQQSPILGVGLGALYPPTTLNNPDLAGFYLHNSYLNILAKMGPIGLAFFLLVVALAVKELIQAGRTCRPRFGSFVWFAAAGAMVQLALFSVYSPALTTSDSVAVAAILIGLAGAWRNTMRVRTHVAI